MMYLEQGMSDKADAVFDRILAMDASFTPEHKHLLNGLGIDLRKSKQLDKAIAFYQKADDLSVEPDEHVLFNMARAYYEKGDMRRTTDLLNRSLKLNPQLKVSQLFLNYLKNQTAKSGKARVYISD
jgi:tetratricopeptide (TPR) repeat protein